MNQVSTMLAHSSVYHKGEAFVVSTIDRESSHPYGGRYAETIVWDISKSNILHMDSAPTMSINVHLKTLDRVFYEGKFWEVKEDE